jgi:hypothetical protein
MALLQLVSGWIIDLFKLPWSDFTMVFHHQWIASNPVNNSAPGFLMLVGRGLHMQSSLCVKVHWNTISIYICRWYMLFFSPVMVYVYWGCWIMLNVKSSSIMLNPFWISSLCQIQLNPHFFAKIHLLGWWNPSLFRDPPKLGWWNHVFLLGWT